MESAGRHVSNGKREKNVTNDKRKKTCNRLNARKTCEKRGKTRESQITVGPVFDSDG